MVQYEYRAALVGVVPACEPSDLAVSEALPEDDCFEDINAFGEFVDLEDLWKFFANIVTHLDRFIEEFSAAKVWKDRFNCSATHPLFA